MLFSASKQVQVCKLIIKEGAHYIIKMIKKYFFVEKNEQLCGH